VKISRRRALAASSVPVAALAALFAGEPPASASATYASAPAIAPAAAAPAVATTSAASSTLLRSGSRGKAVLAAQRRLAVLGYYVGKADGIYGPATTHAVIALQKVAGLARDGVLGPKTAAAMAKGARPRPRTKQGDVIEIDLAHQVLLVVHRGKVRLIFDVSTGSGAYYKSQGRTHHAVTPKGKYHVYYTVNGWDPGPLGRLYRPRYFNGGIAVHGYPSVPTTPASHGCVRVTIGVMDYLWAHKLLPIGRTVLVR
jgi:N-acetylmuramoyl-L-alanine amidase